MRVRCAPTPLVCFCGDGALTQFKVVGSSDAVSRSYARFSAFEEGNPRSLLDALVHFLPYLPPGQFPFGPSSARVTHRDHMGFLHYPDAKLRWVYVREETEPPPYPLHSCLVYAYSGLGRYKNWQRTSPNTKCIVICLNRCAFLPSSFPLSPYPPSLPRTSELGAKHSARPQPVRSAPSPVPPKRVEFIFSILNMLVLSSSVFMRCTIDSPFWSPSISQIMGYRSAPSNPGSRT